MARKKNFIVIDKGWDKLVKDFTRYRRGVSAHVGVQGAEGQQINDGGVTNVGLAAIHEFGRGVPQRSHWRRAFDENRPSYEKGLNKIARQVYDGNSEFIKGELFFLGEEYKADVIRLIYSGKLRPLDAQTVRRKRGDKTTLKDSGEYIGSFSVVVKEGGL